MKNFRVLVAIVCLMVISNLASADIFGSGTNQFTIDFVPISGSTNPTSGYGIVNKDYRMGTYEISNDQWTKFKAAYGAVTGADGGYLYNPSFTGTAVPTNEVSWYEAAQFVNYLNISTNHQAAYKFTGTQGTSDYALGVWQSSDVGYNVNNPYRNSNAFYFLPTENEWVKAAYWNGTNLQTYSNASAGDLVGGSPDPAKWNYSLSVGSELWNATSGAQELNGTYNMMGNVWEWMESPYSIGNYLSGAYRSLRGGSCSIFDSPLVSSNRYYDNLNDEYGDLGFRVASVPEPCSLILFSLCGLLLRRRKQ